MNKLYIVIPTINRADLLMELIDSILPQLDQVEKILIIDNGNQNINIVNDKIEIHKSEKNLGVGGSWNFGIKRFRDEATHILILNDDITLGENQLASIQNNLDDTWLSVGPYYWSAFILYKDCWNHFLNTDGHVFDEKFFPAYFEDNDFHYRIKLANASCKMAQGHLEPKIFRNSMTIRKDPSLNSNFSRNHKYFCDKWGGTPGNEKFTRPFNR